MIDMVGVHTALLYYAEFTFETNCSKKRRYVEGSHRIYKLRENKPREEHGSQSPLSCEVGIIFNKDSLARKSAGAHDGSLLKAQSAIAKIFSCFRSAAALEAPTEKWILLCLGRQAGYSIPNNNKKVPYF